MRGLTLRRPSTLSETTPAIRSTAPVRPFEKVK
jgi:hypothetical protein